MPRRSLLLGRNCRCSYPHPPLRHPQVRCKGCVMVFVVLSFVIFTLSWDGGKGELATSRRARTKETDCAYSRHDLPLVACEK